MKPLIVLIVVFIIGLIVLKISSGKFQVSLSARIAISVMLLFTALGHFMFTDGMILMIPDVFPFKKELVYITAAIEIVASITLHVPQLRIFTAWGLIFFFMLMLPANINASLINLNYQKGTYDGYGLMYLWFRVPLQILFICWVYFTSIKYN